MLRSLNEIRGLRDPIKQNQVDFIISDFPGVNLARITQQIWGKVSGNKEIATTKELRLRATMLTYPGTKIKQSELVLAGFKRRLGTVQDKSGVFTCKITEDNGGSVINLIQAWCDIIHNNMLGYRLPNAFYNVYCQIELGGHCGPQHKRTIYLKNFYPIEYSVNEIDASSSNPIDITVKFNYDFFAENSWSLMSVI